MNTVTPNTLRLSVLCLAIAAASCSSTTDNTTSTSEVPAQTPPTETQVAADNRDMAITAPVEEEIAEADTAGQSPEVSRSAQPQPAQLQRARNKAAHVKAKVQAESASTPYFMAQPISQPEVDREKYQHFKDSGLLLTGEKPVSTFSIDVDTGSYSNVRRFLNSGRMPQTDAVRVEELINYFNYGYAPPKTKKQPFSVNTEVAPAPWAQDRKLLHIGLKGYEVPTKDLPPANLVFLIDVSGSMNSPNKLGLLKQGFKLLVNQMRPQDSVAIAVYAGSSGVVLEPTTGDNKAKILSAIEQLNAGGSTNGAAGIELAYQLAEQNFKKEGINRVLLATDGDFNVGTVNFEALIDRVKEKRKKGVALTTLGFGSGNYNDHLMEQLANKGNGNYAYIDNLQEARKVLVESIGSTLQTIASDVKIQLEFNPNLVKAYRLLGYENRVLRREDFNNDKVDAGEIGAGHTVTAIYELEMVGAKGTSIDPLRYGTKQNEAKGDAKTAIAKQNELGFLKLRYKLPGATKSTLMTTPIQTDTMIADFNKASESFRFAASVAGFGQMLRGGERLQDYGYDQVIETGLAAKGKDTWGYRSEFINLVRLAKEVAK